MKTYKCFCCDENFTDANLKKVKCSENFVGTYNEPWCPKCIAKRKHILSILEEIEEGKQNEGNA